VKNQLWAVGEEASCPFKHHSRASLCQLLQPSSESVLYKMCSLIDAGDYSAACRHHLDSLTVESCSDVCSRMCSSSYAAKKSLVCETVSPEHTADRRVAETSDSGYDSAQSSQPVQENSGCISLNRSSELTATDKRLASRSSNTKNPAESAVSQAADCSERLFDSHAHQQCSITAGVPLKLDDRGICNVQQHIVGSDCATAARKLHSPVDFYASFNCLVTGLQFHAGS